MASADFLRLAPGRRRHIGRSIAVFSILILLAAISPAAQTPATPADMAAKALRNGQFEEVDRLLQSATDPTSIALRARAAMARGRYEDAQKMLTAPAQSAPASDAALQLALLDEQMGRRDVARDRLNKLADTLNAQKPRTKAEWLRFGYASQGLARLALSGITRPPSAA